MPPHPLHPSVVHFPLVFAILLPFFVAGSLWAIRKGAPPRRAWTLPVALAAALFIGSVAALRTGQAEQERVEGVVGEGVLNRHQEAAERFLIFGGVLLLVAGTGFVRGNFGTSARLLTMLGSLALMAAGIQVGAGGGALVYEHGAADAYVNGGPLRLAPQPGERPREQEGRDDRREVGEGHRSHEGP